MTAAFPDTAPPYVFGYGSLIWNPGFPFRRAVPALLRGAHRSLCIYSHHHRGTLAQPGLVLGLVRGGSCRGVAYEVSPEDWSEVHAYLTAREQVTTVYVEARRPILLEGVRAVSALTYLVDERHVQYAGRLAVDEQLRLVRDAVGEAGANVDYVVNTVNHLKKMGIHDRPLEDLVARLQG